MLRCRTNPEVRLGTARFRVTHSYQSGILEKGTMQVSAGRAFQTVPGVESAVHNALDPR